MKNLEEMLLAKDKVRIQFTKLGNLDSFKKFWMIKNSKNSMTFFSWKQQFHEKKFNLKERKFSLNRRQTNPQKLMGTKWGQGCLKTSGCGWNCLLIYLGSVVKKGAWNIYSVDWPHCILIRSLKLLRISWLKCMKRKRSKGTKNYKNYVWDMKWWPVWNWIPN